VSTPITRTHIRPLGRPGDLGWVVMAHGEIYAKEFGWDTSFETLVARIVSDYAAGHDSNREAAWIAELDGNRAGCVFCCLGGCHDGATAHPAGGPGRPRSPPGGPARGYVYFVRARRGV